MMNSVPFDKLGPGQSGRLAYQVLGQDGPIMNPQNIRYLPADSGELPANAMNTSASGLVAGLAGANLICSFLNLGVSVYIASQVAGLHRKMDRLETTMDRLETTMNCLQETVDRLQETMDRIERKVNYIVSKVDRIDIQVAENNLRHALDYVLRQAVSSEGVDLRVLTGLRDDIKKFNDSFSSSLVLNFGLRLSSDIRGRLQEIYDLLYGVRKLVAQRYNMAVGGDPERIITTNPTDDYFSTLGGNLDILVRATTTLSPGQITKYSTLYIPFFLTPPQKRIPKYIASLLSKQIKKMMGLIDFDNHLPEPHDKIFADEDIEATKKGLYVLGCKWLHHSDAGLLFRTGVELGAIAKGYEYFWPQLEKEATPCGFNQIDVVTDLALLEAV